jgi:hypothetical protein
MEIFALILNGHTHHFLQASISLCSKFLQNGSPNLSIFWGNTVFIPAAITGMWLLPIIPDSKRAGILE